MVSLFSEPNHHPIERNTNRGPFREQILLERNGTQRIGNRCHGRPRMRRNCIRQTSRTPSTDNIIRFQENLPDRRSSFSRSSGTRYRRPNSVSNSIRARQRSGAPNGDSINSANRLQFRLNLYKLRENREMKPRTLLNMVSSFLYEHR